MDITNAWQQLRTNNIGAIQKLIIDGDFDPNARDSGGNTALANASARGYIGMVQLLVDNGARVPDENACWWAGRQASHDIPKSTIEAIENIVCKAPPKIVSTMKIEQGTSTDLGKNFVSYSGKTAEESINELRYFVELKAIKLIDYEPKGYVKNFEPENILSDKNACSMHYWSGWNPGTGNVGPWNTSSYIILDLGSNKILTHMRLKTPFDGVHNPCVSLYSYDPTTNTSSPIDMTNDKINVYVTTQSDNAFLLKNPINVRYLKLEFGSNSGWQPYICSLQLYTLRDAIKPTYINPHPYAEKKLKEIIEPLVAVKPQFVVGKNTNQSQDKLGGTVRFVANIDSAGGTSSVYSPTGKLLSQTVTHTLPPAGSVTDKEQTSYLRIFLIILVILAVVAVVYYFVSTQNKSMSGSMATHQYMTAGRIR